MRLGDLATIPSLRGGTSQASPRQVRDRLEKVRQRLIDEGLLAKNAVMTCTCPACKSNTSRAAVPMDNAVLELFASALSEDQVVELYRTNVVTVISDRGNTYRVRWQDHYLYRKTSPNSYGNSWEKRGLYLHGLPWHDNLIAQVLSIQTNEDLVLRRSCNQGHVSTV